MIRLGQIDAGDAQLAGDRGERFATLDRCTNSARRDRMWVALASRAVSFSAVPTGTLTS